MHVSSNLDWKAHIDKLCSILKQPMGLLRRIKHKITKDKLQIVAEAIFTSKIRYGLAVYGQPRLTVDEPIGGQIQKIQVIQNDLLRLLNGHRRSDHINMNKLRKQRRMMSINQLTVYHVGLETYNVLKNNSSEQLKEKMIKRENEHYTLRSQERGDLLLPTKPKRNCTGFSYTGAKVWNALPVNLRRDDISPTIFKRHLKTWIWDQIPS